MVNDIKKTLRSFRIRLSRSSTTTPAIETNSPEAPRVVVTGVQEDTDDTDAKCASPSHDVFGASFRSLPQLVVPSNRSSSSSVTLTEKPSEHNEIFTDRINSLLDELCHSGQARRIDPSTLEDVKNKLDDELARLESHGSRSKSLKLAKDFTNNIVNPFEEFFGILGQFVSSQNEVAKVVWGLLKLSIGVIGNYYRYFDRLVSLLRSVGQELRSFNEYINVFKDDSRADVVDVMGLICLDILRLCINVHSIFIRKDNTVRCRAHIAWKFLSPWQRQKFDAVVEGLKDHQQFLKTSKEEAKEQWELRKMKREEREALQNKRDSLLSAIKSSGYFLPTIEQYRDSNLKKLRDTRAGEWLLSSEEFGRFLSQSNASLWVKGEPGCGKTILSSIIANNLQETHPMDGFALFFCQHDVPRSLDSEVLLGTILYQLIQRLPAQRIPALLLELSPADVVNSPKDIKHAIISILESQSFQTTRLVIDGLDECTLGSPTLIASVTNDLIDTLNELSRYCSVVATSRSGIRSISDTLNEWPTIHISKQDTRDDISRFVEQSLKRLSPVLRQRAHRLLIGKADGSMIWVAFEVRHLERLQDNERDVDDALQHLPQSSEINRSIDRSLRQIQGLPKPQQRRAKRALRWVVVSKDRLTLSQLREAVLTEEMSGSWDPSVVQSEPLDRIVENCFGLLSLSGDTEDPTVQVFHACLTTYLLSASDNVDSELSGYHYAPISKAHIKIAVGCMDFLWMDQTQNDNRDEPKVISRYIIENWYLHFREAESAFINTEALSSFRRLCECDLPSNGLTSRPWLLSSSCYWHIALLEPSRRNQVQFANLFGLQKLRDYFVQSTDILQSYEQDPLSEFVDAFLEFESGDHLSWTDWHQPVKFIKFLKIKLSCLLEARNEKSEVIMDLARCLVELAEYFAENEISGKTEGKVYLIAGTSILLSVYVSYLNIGPLHGLTPAESRRWLRKRVRNLKNFFETLASEDDEPDITLIENCQKHITKVICEVGLGLLGNFERPSSSTSGLGLTIDTSHALLRSTRSLQFFARLRSRLLRRTYADRTGLTELMVAKRRCVYRSNTGLNDTDNDLGIGRMPRYPAMFKSNTSYM